LMTNAIAKMTAAATASIVAHSPFREGYLLGVGQPTFGFAPT
jgi:hypothetical protein